MALEPGTAPTSSAGSPPPSEGGSPLELRVDTLSRPDEIPVGVFRQLLVRFLLLLTGGTLGLGFIAETILGWAGHDAGLIRDTIDKALPLEFSALTAAIGYYFGRATKDE